MPPSSPRRAQLAQASRVASSRSNRLLEEYSGGPKWAWVLFAPPFLLSTPPLLFLVILFRKVTETYEFRNDTCFLSVMLRNLVDYIIIPFLTYGTSLTVQRCFHLISGVSRNLTDCASIFSFDFRHVPELHKLPNDGCQAPHKDQTKVACHQAKVPGRN